MAFPNSPYELDPHQEIFSYFNDQIQNVQSADPSTSNNVAQQPFSSPFIPPSQPNNQEFAFTFTGGAPPTVSQPAPAFSETQGYHNPQWSSSQSSQPAPFGLSISSPVDSLTATRSAPYDSGGIAFEAYMPPGTRHVPEIAHPQPVRGHGAPHGFRGVNPSHGGPDPDANTQTSAQMPYTRRVSSRRGGHSRPSLIQTATMRARARQLTQDDSNRGSPSVAPRRPQKRRRGPGDDSEEYETESDAELAPTATTTTISTASSSPQTVRLPGACTNCRRVKMKCEFKPDDPMTCRRCRSSGLHCHVEPRRPAMRSNKRQILLDRIRYLEENITRLIKKIHDPILPAPISVIPARASNTLGVIAETNHRNIQAWIEKAQASIRPGSNSFLLDTRAFLDHYSSSGSDSEDGSVKGEGEDPSQTRTPSRESLKRTAGGSPKLRSIPMEGTVYGLLANMSLDAIRGHSQRLGQRLVGGQDEGQDSAPQEDDVGVASETYFRPGPVANPDLRKIIIERQMPPEILVNGLVSPVEVDKLFKIFFDKINVFMALLDPMIYTPETTLGRSPFLFTVVCAISSRFYTERPELYKTAMQYAKTAAAAALVDGWKSVEVCQAYILLTAYPIAVRRWEDDRSWLYLGLAIRMATDLDLHRPTTKKPMNEQHEREILNRTRTWLHLFNLDRTLSAQFGKPSMIQEDWITRNSKEWFRKSIYNMEYDVHTCTYTELLRTVSQFHSELFSDMNSLTGLNQNLDFRAIAVRYDEELKNVKDDAFVRYKTYSREDHGCIMRAHILPFYYNYFRLVMFSFGFQQAVEKGLRPGDDFLQRCLEAASSVVKVMAESLIPTGLVRYAPDAYSLSSTFAAAFLLKLLRPEFTSFLDEIQRTRIIELVTKLIDILGSNDVAVDASHSPKIYSRFLGSHLEKHLKAAQPPKPQPSPRSGAPYKRQRTLDSTRGESPSTIASSSRPSTQQTQQTRTTQTLERWSPGPSGQPRPPMPSPTEASGLTAAGTSPGMQVGTVDDHSMDFVAAMHIISQPGFNWDRWDNVIMPGFPWEQDSQPPS